MADEGETGRGTPEKDTPTVWSAVGQHAGYGLTIAASLGLFMAAGWWVDGRLGTTPLLAVVGALVGAAAGFYSMYRDLVVEPRERERARRDREDGR